MATVETYLHLAPGCHSAEAAAFLAGLDDQHQRLIEATRTLSPHELSWQPAPGMNTIGMLLAHVAVAEVHVTDVGISGRAESRVKQVLGLDTDDDGLPLPEDGAPPAHLSGRDIAYFHDLLSRARAHCRAAVETLGDEDLSRTVERSSPDGSRRRFDVRWMVYHLLEHEAGHHGQILLLRHLHQARAGR